MRAILDTGFIVAFANANDIHHAWALEVAARFVPPGMTCEAVLAETAYHLRDAEYVLQLVASRFVIPAFNVADNLEQLLELALRYSDRSPDLADLCLIRMSELHPRHVVVTTDKADFRVYRRHKRDVIPLLCPPTRGR